MELGEGLRIGKGVGKWKGIVIGEERGVRDRDRSWERGRG